LLDRGIGHVYIKLATPRLNGKVERSHRIDNEGLYRMLGGVVIDDTGLGMQGAVTSCGKHSAFGGACGADAHRFRHAPPT
jgi:hypothetical protein